MRTIKKKLFNFKHLLSVILKTAISAQQTYNKNNRFDNFYSFPINKISL